ncbi:MAG: radical SAM protein, partial [Cyanobacteria bacterium J06641_5]
MVGDFSQERLLFEPASPQVGAVPVIYAFPNNYNVGITSLGYQVVWATLALRSDVQVSRLFLDRTESLPQQPELLGFSLSWELDYANILSLLERLEIPISATQRSQNHPLVFGGGPVLTANPEPFAEFFDVILLGDGEELLDAFVEAYQEVRGGSRAQKLQALAQVPGVYIPSLYRVEYVAADGELAAIVPIASDVPE